MDRPRVDESMEEASSQAILYLVVVVLVVVGFVIASLTRVFDSGG